MLMPKGYKAISQYLFGFSFMGKYNKPIIIIIKLMLELRRRAGYNKAHGP
jgi:hypothetical protein